MDELKLTQPKVRPLFLTVLCIIAFFHIGLIIVLGLFSTIASGIPNIFKALPYLDDFAGLAASLKGGLLFSMIALVLAIVSFLGLIQMWNMLKTGFWVFSISMVLFLAAPFILLSLPFNWVLYITLPNLIIIPLLVILFAFNYKKLGRLYQTPNQL